MTKSNFVDLDSFMEEFVQLERKVNEISGQNSMLEVMVEDTIRNMKYLESKEKSVAEEKDCLLVAVSRLQQTLQEQCNLRVENESLKKDLAAVREDSERTAEVAQAELQRLLCKLGAEEERHQRALEAVRQQCRREAEESRLESISKQEAKEAEVTKLLETKDTELEEMKRRMKDRERERQSELLKLQIEFGAKLARVQWNQQPPQQQQQPQHQGSQLIPQSVFRRKLQVCQEEKNKEIAALRQRIRELEENQLTSFNNNNNSSSSSSSSRLKRRRLSFHPATEPFNVNERMQK